MYNNSIKPSPKMMPIIFNQCHPISNITELNQVIQEPPTWASKVQPLVPRSGTVVKNTLDDCHAVIQEFSQNFRIDARCAPKTLVCHDYKGGYQTDRYLHNPDEEVVGNGYTFYNWAQIDIFVYFSHHFITIPPLCWINAGHKNGVKVLGTLITEFDSGQDICDTKIFKDLETTKTFAQSLAHLTKIFGFDGWLLNIENRVKNIQALKVFVQYFTQLIHQVNPGNLVIWYDSVTVHGDLSWQNELNSKNQYFFDSCDGIFLNYSWNEKHITNSVEAAKHRNFDVFVGIDVFGRNMYGGGKFNTAKAVEMAHRSNLSIALFAPGWTHETIEQHTEHYFETFFNRDMAFWRSFWTCLHTHPISSYFTTNFYIGLDKECYNMFSQETQSSQCLYPSNTLLIPEFRTINIPNSCSCIQGTVIGSKNVCLLTKSNLPEDVPYIHNLFVTDIEIKDNTVVFFLTKSVDEGDSLSVIDVTLLVGGSNGILRKIVLLGEKKEKPEETLTLLEVNKLDAVDIYNSVKDKYYKEVVDDQWTLSVYIFNTPLSRIMQVGATIKHTNSVLLGAFGIEDADGNFLKTM